MNRCVYREAANDNNDASNLNESASSYQGNHNGSISMLNLQTIGKSAQRNNIVPRLATNVASLVAAVQQKEDVYLMHLWTIIP